jgi:hypothetical protein
MDQVTFGHYGFSRDEIYFLEPAAEGWRLSAALK